MSQTFEALCHVGMRFRSGQTGNLVFETPFLTMAAAQLTSFGQNLKSATSAFMAKQVIASFSSISQEMGNARLGSISSICSTKLASTFASKIV